MLYYVYIQDDKITAKGHLTKRIELSEGYKEVTKEIYDSIGAMPCSFVEENGAITSVEYIEPVIIPEQQESVYQKTLMEKIEENKQAIAELTLLLTTMTGGV